MSTPIGESSRDLSQGCEPTSSSTPLNIDINNSEPYQPRSNIPGPTFIRSPESDATLSTSNSTENDACIQPTLTRSSRNQGNDHRDEKIPMPELPISEHPAFRSTSISISSSPSTQPTVLPGSYHQPLQQGFVLPVQESDAASNTGSEDEDVPLPNHQALAVGTSNVGSLASPTSISATRIPRSSNLVAGVTSAQEEDILPPPPSYEQAISRVRSSRHGSHVRHDSAIPLHAFPSSTTMHTNEHSMNSSTPTSHIIAGSASLSARTSPLSTSPAIAQQHLRPENEDASTSIAVGTASVGDTEVEAATHQLCLRKRKRKKIRFCVCIFVGLLLFLAALVIGITIGLLKGQDSDVPSNNNNGVVFSGGSVGDDSDTSGNVGQRFVVVLVESNKSSSKENDDDKRNFTVAAATISTRL